MTSHLCSEVRGVVAHEYTHDTGDYGPSKVMPSMEPMGQFDRRPMLVHGTRRVKKRMLRPFLFQGYAQNPIFKTGIMYQQDLSP